MIGRGMKARKQFLCQAHSNVAKRLECGVFTVFTAALSVEIFSDS